MIETSAQKFSSHPMYSAWYNLRVAMVQHLLYGMVQVLAIFMVRKRIVGIETSDIVVGTRYVVVANHQNRVDPAILMGLVPFRVYRKLGTWRFFAHAFFFNKFIARTFMVDIGAFPAKTHPFLPHGLRYAQDQLDVGRTVLILPEGRRSLPNDAPAKPGVGKMAKWPNVMIIPIHINWHRRSYFGRTIDVNVGKPFDGSKMTAQEILDRVYALPLK